LDFLILKNKLNFRQHIFDNNDLPKGSCIALLGGGGKTALLNKLTNEFSQIFDSVLHTSITKTIYCPLHKPLLISEIENVNLNLYKIKHNPAFIIGNKISKEKFNGITELELEILRHQFDITLFECDGARNKPLKVHNSIDPIIPKFVTHTIIVVGADIIGTKVRDGFVHRPNLFCKTWEVSEDDILIPDLIVEVLTSEQGYLSKIKHECEKIFFVNKSDISVKNSKILATQLLKKGIGPAFFGSVQQELIEHA